MYNKQKEICDTGRIFLSYNQEKREEKLDEREVSLKAKEEEVVLMRKAIYEHADDITAS